MIRVAIFDLDGTLIDSHRQITDAANTARTTYGFPPIDDTVSQQVIGLPAIELFRDLGGETAANRIVDTFREVLMGIVKEGNTTFDGVIPYLAALKSNSHRIAVATSKPQALAEAVVENSALAQYVDIVSGIDDCAPKPDPTVILRALTRAQSDTGVMFGDRPEDIEAAIRSGIPCVGVAQTAFSEEFLKQAGATVTVESFTELLDPTRDLVVELT